jgi:streptolysin S family bacteriocin protoxin
MLATEVDVTRFIVSTASCCCCFLCCFAVDLVSQQAAGDADAVAPDVAKAVYALAAASGSETAYNMLVAMYEQVGR